MTDPVDRASEFWERHARTDPLWAVLSDPTKKGRKWDLGQFLESGVREISLLMYQLDELGLTISRKNALDFGCGVGRLTLGLAAFFDDVVGVDVSPTMIQLAEKLNSAPDRVRYILNVRDDLRAFLTNQFDLLYTDIVLQHIEPALTGKYLEEFLRILRPGGLLIFQLPSHRRPVHDASPAAKPMPDDAYRASIVVDRIPASPLQASAEIPVPVMVTNVSGCDWRQDECGPIRIGNHWRDGPGTTMLIQDDGRAFLPGVLHSGETCHVTLRVRTPARAGEYQCEIDVVHEAISWFADKRSIALRFAVSVGEDGERQRLTRDAGPSIAFSTRVSNVPGAASAIVLPDIHEGLPEQSGEPGEFPMFGLHRDNVVDLIRNHQGTLLHLETDERCGKEWVGYRYFVRKQH